MLEFIVFIVFSIALFSLYGRITNLEKRLKYFEDSASMRIDILQAQQNEIIDAPDHQNSDIETKTQDKPARPVATLTGKDAVKSEAIIDEAIPDESVDYADNEANDYADPTSENIVYTAAKTNQNETEFVASANESEADVGATAKESQKAGFNLDFEEFFGRRLPIWAGGITLAIAGLLIAKYASDNGYLSASVKIIFGFIFGGGLIAGAELAFRKEDWVRDPRVRQALSGAGIATLYASFYVGHNVYDIFGPLTAFIGMAAVTAGALGLSLRFGAPSAVLGLIGGLVTPALIGSTEPNIPMLTLYLALTIGGLTAVSKSQKWAWLGISALVGGTGWGFILIATSALDFATSLSVGALILLLALIVPFFTYAGARNSLLRIVSIIVGSGQLALLVAKGGFEPLQWGIFCLMALAAQYIAHRESKFDIVRSVSLGISAVLLMLWPEPDIIAFAIVATILLLTHAIPLLLILWQVNEVEEGDEKGPPLEKLLNASRFQKAIEIAIISIAVLVIPMWHYYFSYQFSLSGFGWSIIAIGGASINAIAIARGWNAKRDTDNSFALLSAACTALLSFAYFFAAPIWAWPLGMAFFGTALLLFGYKAADIRLEKVSAIFTCIALPLMLLYNIGWDQEIPRLYQGSDGTWDMYTLLRWGGLAALFSFFAYKVRARSIQTIMQAIAMLLVYGLLAQFNASAYLPFLLGAIACTLTLHRLAWPVFAPAFTVISTLIVLWAAQPIVYWSISAAYSLMGIPMTIDTLYSFGHITAYVIAPTLLTAAALYIMRTKLPSNILFIAYSVTSLAAFVALHSAYKIAFSSIVGSDFISYALLERVMWEALLIAIGWTLWRLCAAHKVAHYAAAALVGAASLHGLYYSIIIHNPLIVEQAVGPWPIINLIIPTFAMIILSAILLKRIVPEFWSKYGYYWQFILMALVTIFAYTTLRQFFHGSILAFSELQPFEDIARSIVAIILAIAYLLWGIKSKQRSWRVASLFLMLGAVGKVFIFDAAGLDGLLRIASFVALGFSLIGIGWLYSRQVRSNSATA